MIVGGLLPGGYSLYIWRRLQGCRQLGAGGHSALLETAVAKNQRRLIQFQLLFRLGGLNSVLRQVQRRPRFCLDRSLPLNDLRAVLLEARAIRVRRRYGDAAVGLEPRRPCQHLRLEGCEVAASPQPLHLLSGALDLVHRGLRILNTRLFLLDGLDLILPDSAVDQVRFSPGPRRRRRLDLLATPLHRFALRHLLSFVFSSQLAQPLLPLAALLMQVRNDVCDPFAKQFNRPL